MSYCVYILRCDDNSYYVGHTENLSERFETHLNGHGAAHTKKHSPKEIVYTEKFETKADAARREIQIKKWSRAKKEALVSGEFYKLKELSKKDFQKKISEEYLPHHKG